MKIRISDIVVGKRIRPHLNPKEVERIAKSFEEEGQKRAILIRTDGKRPRLVAGARRLAAAKKLRWTHIEARALKLDGLSKELADIEAQLAEIDDNFSTSLLRKGKGRV